MRRALCLVLLLACGTLSAQTEKDRPAKGTLDATLVVTDLQAAPAGYNGQKWVVKPTGQWQVSQVKNLTETAIQTGRFSDKELAALVGQLGKYNLKGLLAQPAARATASPHQIRIKLGEDEFELGLDAESTLPKPDTKTTEGRVSGILEVVRKALPAKARE
jgi:hypothetical protein